MAGKTIAAVEAVAGVEAIAAVKTITGVEGTITGTMTVGNWSGVDDRLGDNWGSLGDQWDWDGTWNSDWDGTWHGVWLRDRDGDWGWLGDQVVHLGAVVHLSHRGVVGLGVLGHDGRGVGHVGDHGRGVGNGRNGSDDGGENLCKFGGIVVVVIR